MLLYRVIALYTMLLLVGNKAETKHIEGAAQFRITESEFNKVASVLIQQPDPYIVDMKDGKTKGVHNYLSYEIEKLVHKSSGEEVNVQVPETDKKVATTFFSNIQLSGKINLTRLIDSQFIYDGDFEVTLKNVTILSLIGMSEQVVSSSNLHAVNIDVFNCSADIDTIFVAEDTSQNIAVHVTDDDLEGIFQNVVCQTYKMRFSLGFGESRISFRILDQPLIVGTEACGLEIKEKTFIITQKVKTAFAEKTLLPDDTVDILSYFPPLDPKSNPFEIFIHIDIFNELFRKFKQNLGIGSKKVMIANLLPNLKDLAELNTEGLYMELLFPMVKDTYPDAVGRIVVLDGDIYFTIKNGSLQLHFDMTCDLSVTLNCDKNRTYSAFNFTMNLFFPTQVGYNNKILTLKFLGFGGNFTVLNSTVGHIVDRQVRSLLYAAPYYAASGMDKLNDMMQGIPLADFLPEDVFVMVRNISIKKDNVVVGGSLSLTDQELQSEIRWAGKTISEDDLYLLGHDRTSEDLRPEKEKNCKNLPPIISSAAVVTYQAVMLCIMTNVIYF